MNKYSVVHELHNPYNVVGQFEKVIAKYAGSPYGVAVDSCTAAIFLCIKYFCEETVWGHQSNMEITIPARTYPSVPMEILHAGCKVKFLDYDWEGVYQLSPLPIYDGAKRFKKNMFLQNTYHCLSFHYKKHLPIGRGGMILTNDIKAARWLRRARFMGRTEGRLLTEDKFTLGWNLYMEPERAARGLMLFHMIKNLDLPDLIEEYPDLSKQECFK